MSNQKFMNLKFSPSSGDNLVWINFISLRKFHFSEKLKKILFGWKKTWCFRQQTFNQVSDDNSLFQ